MIQSTKIILVQPNSFYPEKIGQGRLRTKTLHGTIKKSNIVKKGKEKYSTTIISHLSAPIILSSTV